MNKITIEEETVYTTLTRTIKELRDIFKLGEGDFWIIDNEPDKTIDIHIYNYDKKQDEDKIVTTDTEQITSYNQDYFLNTIGIILGELDDIGIYDTVTDDKQVKDQDEVDKQKIYFKMKEEKKYEKNTL